MVKGNSGQIIGESKNGCYVRIVWEEEYQGNSSDITGKVYLVSNNFSVPQAWVEGKKVSFAVNGFIYEALAEYDAVGNGNSHSTVLLSTFKHTGIAHRANGTQSVAIYASAKAIYRDSDNNIVETTFTAQKQVDLFTISPATVPTAADQVEMGKTLAITLNGKSNAYTHDITYSFGSATGTIATAATTSATWSVSLELAKQIRNKQEETAEISCVTKNGTTVIGTQKIYITLTVPCNDTTKPTASMALIPTGSLASTFAGLYIQNKTGLKATFTASSTYSQLADYTLTLDNGQSASGNPASVDKLRSNGTRTVKGVVADARGYLKEISKTITVLPYSDAAVKAAAGEASVICRRCASDGTYSSKGTYLHIKAQRSYSMVKSGGVQKNFCILRYRYKQYLAADSTYSAWTALIAKSNTSTNTVDIVIPDVVARLDKSYTVQINAADDLGASHTIEIHIPTGKTAFHLKAGGNGAAFGKYAEVDDTLELAEGWKLKIGDTVLSEEQLEALLKLI